MKQKSFFVIFNILMLGMFVIAAAPVDVKAPQNSEVKEVLVVDSLIGFKDWKQKRVFTARAALDQFKSQQIDPNETLGVKPVVVAENQESVDSQKKLAEKKQTPEEKKRGEKLRQLEFNLEISLGLTIHDYFALYLKNKSKEDMVQAVQKLSPEELSELMLAYKKSLYGAPKALSKDQAVKNQKL